MHFPPCFAQFAQSYKSTKATTVPDFAVILHSINPLAVPNPSVITPYSQPARHHHIQPVHNNNRAADQAHLFAYHTYIAPSLTRL